MACQFSTKQKFYNIDKFSFFRKNEIYWTLTELTDRFTPSQIYQEFINSCVKNFQSDRTYETINPATEEPICKIPKANSDDVNKAVAAAKAVCFRYFLTCSSNRYDRLID